jgi:hypothetical protein
MKFGEKILKERRQKRRNLKEKGKPEHILEIGNKKTITHTGKYKNGARKETKQNCASN